MKTDNEEKESLRFKRSYSTENDPGFSSSPGPNINATNITTSTTKTFGNVFRLIPEEDDNHIRNAFYNVLAFLCLIIILGILVAVYFVLQKFLRPIAWALLFGAFLHPFKRKLTKNLYDWVDSITIPQSRKDKNNRTFLFSLFYSPIKYLATTTERIGDNILCKWKFILKILTAVTCLYLAHHLKIITAFMYLFTYFSNLFINSFDFWISIFSGKWVCALLIAYFVSIIFFDYDKNLLRYSSYVVWLLILCNVAYYIPNYHSQSFVFLLMSGLYLGGLFYDINLHKTLYKESDSKNSVEIYNIPQLNVNTYQNINSDNMLTDKKNQNINVNNMIENEHKILNEIKNINDKSEQQAWDSNRYIMFLLWCCLFIEFYKWVLLILPLSILIAIIRRIGYHFGVWTIIYDRTYNSLSRCQNLKDNLKDFRLALINTPIKGVYELFLTLDRMIISSIRNSIDTATTVLLMFFTFITLLSLGIFLSFQIYQESAHLVNVVHSAVNSTIVENQWFQPSEQMEKSVDSVLESGYNAGREWIANQFTTLNQQNSNKDLSKLESQILILWDHVYDNMIKKGTMFKLSGGNKSSIMNKNLLVHNWQNIVESVTQLGSAHKDGIMKFVKENIDTLNSVLTTIWLIIKSNINLVFMISSNTLAFIFGGGTAILNFFLSWIIFLSTLVYFLSSSGEQYKPVQLFTQFMPGNEDNTEKTKQTIQIVDPNPDSKSASPSEEGQKEVSVISTTTVTTIKSKVPQKEAQDHSRKDHAKESPNEKDFDKSGSKETKGKEGGSTGANKIALAIQEAISGVFAATLKMATFYGLYTWLMHKIFGVGMVYIPTALASIFAAVPFVGTYVASLPATLELWILTGSYVIPLIFFALHLLPKFFVDATIYKEIKGGGHPYFTGLSIVGGIYMFGLEGALIGPMLLCCLFAGLKVFGAYMHEE